MGFDIGYHAVSREDIVATFDYIFGKKASLPYLEKAVITARSRHIANAWGLGIHQYKQDILYKAMDLAKEEAQSKKPNFLGRLMGKKAPEPEFPKIDYNTYIGEFDTDLHLWGRPFLITQSDRINKLIEQYLVANEHQSKELAQRQIDLLKPSLHLKIEPDKQPLPDLDEFRNIASWKMDILKKCVEVYPEKVEGRDGERYNSADVLNSSMNFYVLENVSLAHPTWMDRGYVWPSYLLENIGIHPDYFNSFSELYPLKSHLPSEVSIRNEKTITENYMVGAVVMPKDIGRFKSDLRNAQNTILKQATKEGWDFHCRQALQKIEECLDYAQNHKLCFVESSDIYSGPMGIMT